jgi:HSP20 family molecular chaperone IbpA
VREGVNVSIIKKQRKKNKKTIIVPPTGVTENGKSICITSQLPDIPEEKIRIDLERTRLIISASKQNEKVMREIIVPDGSRISEKKFKDGVLEIILDRPL